MRIVSLTWLIAFALVPAANAEVYLTDQEALALAFPDADRIEKRNAILTQPQREAIERIFPAGKAERIYTYYVGEKEGAALGYAAIDNVLGKVRPITYLLATDASIRTQRVEVLAYRESHGGEIRHPNFRKQYIGKSADSELRLGKDIQNIAGATLSCRSLTDGVRRNLIYLETILGNGKEDGPAEGGPDRLYRETRWVMGAPLDIAVGAPSKTRASAAMESAYEEVRRLEKIFSVYDPESELSRLNRRTDSAGEAIALSEDLHALLQLGQTVWEKTDGAFDMTVAPLVSLWKKAEDRDAIPNQQPIAEALAQVGGGHLSLSDTPPSARIASAGIALDSGGIAKGYALDSAAEILRASGIASALLNFAGQLRVVGEREEGAGWPSSIASTEDSSRFIEALDLRAGSLSITADDQRGLRIDGQRFSHVIDPRTGRPVAGMRQVAVHHPNAAWADALSTGLYAAGFEEASRLAQREGWAVLLIDEAGNEFRSEAWERLTYEGLSGR